MENSKELLYKVEIKNLKNQIKAQEELINLSLKIADSKTLDHRDFTIDYVLRNAEINKENAEQALKNAYESGKNQYKKELEKLIKEIYK